ncbi:hypothetical protein CNE_1c10970 [Cupriavidus necator N-1]|jgi:dissimilatory sulfite reductase (desulfoviridin) alpha/beta subunit|uniref:Uncharacterized protein n=1 Tax=Cupriavidus necator (strain ATCC 43291 / DSM 13513 / CCUG 52238 / LMG 8453 / N-1) TaxID=1042878 RepID=G0F0X5_CUPNN|nr:MULTISPECIES: hypothetical protein [Cupriavidus]AEI76453.1 hypothetical protein CNE_1c10970 [Cupriavidus necator N-1]KAI3596335.1 hypothetical protein D8I24_7529 [Cupriavidus necator H850]MDX6011424.1 hypothetical protein [Cupriavidus necator]QUN29451.1 hypothetical protein KB879_05745 [Cupriavidus sp. KK10]
MTEIGEWKKKVYETHEVQVQVRQRSQSEWSYTVRVCRPGTNIRAAGTLTETSRITEHYKSREAAEVAGFAHGERLAKQLA